VTAKALPRWTRTDPARYREVVDKAIRTGRWVKLNRFGNERSAATIVWMIENGKGIRAFEAFEPHFRVAANGSLERAGYVRSSERPEA
jgi:hypothetical protein